MKIITGSRGNYFHVELETIKFYSYHANNTLLPLVMTQAF